MSEKNLQNKPNENNKVKEKVRNHWANLDYKTLNRPSTSQTNNDETLNLNNTSSNNQKRSIIDIENVTDVDKGNHLVIDLTDDAEEMPHKKRIKTEIKYGLKNSTHKFPGFDNDWCFKLIKSKIYDSNINSSSYLLDMKDIFHDPFLQDTFIFSYQFDLEYIYSMLHENIERIFIIGQKGTIIDYSTNEYTKFRKKTSIRYVKNPNMSNHHCKMIVNLYRDGSAKIFMPSQNMRMLEQILPQQVCWISPLLLPSKKTKIYSNSNSNSNSDLDLGHEFDSPFLQSLRDFLSFYEYGYVNILEGCFDFLDDLDYASLDDDIQIVFSAPKNDRHHGSAMGLFGSLGLCGSKEELEKKKATRYLAQVSSIGYGIYQGNLFTHHMIPQWAGLPNMVRKHNVMNIFKEYNIQPMVVFPTTQEIKDSPTHGDAAGWFHNIGSNSFESQKIFYKQGPNVSKERGTTPSHSKYYMKSTCTDEDPFKYLDWCIYTSSNLSMSAWGTDRKDPRNFEIGIVIKPKNGGKLKCHSFVDLIYNRPGSRLNSNEEAIGPRSVLVPFPKQLEGYSDRDFAFSQ
ncbi:hypothetical protein TBLA_0A10020 [Henningerozyma blattae CBS 6284]|uniref:Tyrosyl-DNA phosphodiesterase 1 n=1 Tax=Henningerozyma blattae (strain ATCC 34711 / CBS 6284 / DSM 70876 / NBRC 10599 / NRRL Y-10934 / UCD 77-7) TaxID=1071380 RepID=I2GXD0_HENB6|nr:hypothetical protein TBLA_0A10020 [Tetrapisispora blattae CBS 6284]CCH58782.1 hypothetical protein TBLA_0A10020 [Tetrapisispora blattae CBS 6284]